jgi:hypothetical protein
MPFKRTGKHLRDYNTLNCEYEFYAWGCLAFPSESSAFYA